MTKVVGLFGSAQDAEKLLERLQETRFEDVEVQVIERAGEGGGVAGGVFVAPAPASPSATGANVPVPLPVNFDEGLAGATADASERDFFIDGVRGGGVLVVTESNDELAPEIRQMMEEHNGRVSGGRREAQ
jgi:hypothetical protein